MRAPYFLKKTILFFFSLTIFSSLLFSQQTEFTYGNRWRFGINMGGMWQASDLQKNYAGFGGGFTIEKGLTSNRKTLLYFDLRYRFLTGNTYGLDGRVNHNISKNNAVNGTTDSVSNYVSFPGYYFNNYQTKITQHDLELKVGFNQLLQKRNIHLYLWGGIGLTNVVTKVDALDATGSKYSFTGIDTTGGYASLPKLNNIFDGKSETLGNGMPGSGGKLFVAPSLGVGFGYKFTDVFSLIFEHKITFPRTDIMDGEQFFQKKNTWSATNDYYHYSGATLLFTFKKSSRSTTYTDQNQHTSNTNPPQVIIVSPSANPYSAPAGNAQVYADVKNVSSASGVNISLNGAPFTTFNFTPASGALSFDVPLQAGSNVVMITGTNTYGSASQSVTINYNQGPTGSRPVVTISSPLNNSAITSNSITVNGYVRNVSKSNQVAVSVNGNILNNFNFNPSNGDVSFNAFLNQGNNSITISGTNDYGSDSKTVNVNLNNSINQLPKPVVIITNPPQPGFLSGSQTFTFTAVVTEITSSSQLSVQVNGKNNNDFKFNPSSGSLTLPVFLQEGSTSFAVTATNNNGFDTKTTTVTYKTSLPQGNPPAITFINPPTTPFATASAVINIQAFVNNVSTKADVQLMINGVADNNFSFNAQTKILDYTLNMFNPSYIVSVKGTNAYGSDTESATINYNRPEQKPVVSFSNPATNPFVTTTAFINVIAKVLNVSEKSQISVLMNGTAIPFNWNASAHEVQFSTGTDKSSNSVVVTGTNSAGADSKTLIINVNENPKGKKPTVVISAPASPGSIVPVPSYSFSANIVGVQSVSDIIVSLNGVNVAAQYNNGVVTYMGTLAEGNNNFSVSATNASGSAQASTTIIFQPQVVVKPVVVITSPASPGTTVTSSNYSFSANVSGVQSGSDITVQLNGVNVNPFFNNGLITFNGTLVEGNNNFTVSATNSGGSSLATTTIIYKPALVLKPAVVITTPTSPGTTVVNSAFQFVASVTGVTNSKGITVQFNGVKVGAQYSSGVLSYSAVLVPGNNNFSVSASNNSGTSQESTTIIYQPVQQVAPPVVIITNPVSSGSTVTAITYQFVASVSGVTSSGDVRAQFNGVNVNVQYNNGVVSYQGNLIQGNNTFSLSATNPGGTSQATTSIIYQQPAPQVLPPIINITNPSSAGTIVNEAAFAFSAKISNISSSAGLTVKFNSAVVKNFNFSPASGSFTFISSLQAGNNTLEITASNSSGSDFKTASITYNIVTTPGDPNKGTGNGGSHGTGNQNNGQGGHGNNTGGNNSGTDTTGTGDPNKGGGTGTGGGGHGTGTQNNGQGGHGGTNANANTGTNTGTTGGKDVINTIIEKNILPGKGNNTASPNSNPVIPGKGTNTNDPAKNPANKTESTPEVKPK